jgi:haloalkane dehalogenase
MGGSQRRNLHRFMADTRRHDYTTVVSTVAQLSDRPLLTIFGERNDPLHFQPGWKKRFPDVIQIVIPKGLHFPMCDAPDTVADAIATWHTDQLLLPES